MQTALYAIGVTLLSIIIAVPCLYGLHMYLMLALAMASRGRVRRAQNSTISRFRATTADDRWPIVTTQIPLYNELPVARRVIEAVAAIDYPIERHQIQVLDDSNDSTREVVDAVVRQLAARGHDISVVRRPERRHFKAGALQHGLQSARGEFVAVFDADFVPQPSFLRSLVPLLASDERACCVQGRWGHLNRDETWITRALSLGIDGHFGVEQPARAWNGLLLNFNGTAGIWRRAAIDDPRVGGWDGDTLTEDLDLSYRAQLAGWRVAYHVDEVAPAELPADPDALKTQQRRWATGSIQCARKLLGAVWMSKLSPFQKVEGTIHLLGYSVNVMMLLMALFGRPLAALLDGGPGSISWAWIVMSLATLGPILAYCWSRASFGQFVNPLDIPKVLLLGLGLAVNNTVAVLAGIVQRGGEFIRTPKSGSTGGASVPAAGGRAHARTALPTYAAIRSRLWMFELICGVLCVGQWLLFLPIDGPIGSMFLLLYGVGFLTLGYASVPRARSAALTSTREQVGYPALAESPAPST